jgi:D-inositol-3-phosphate glycosyltransferase
MESTLGALCRRWDILHHALNYRGAPIDVGWRVLPQRDIGDRLGLDAIPPLVDAFVPDAILLFNSFLDLPRYESLPRRLGQRRPVIVAQCPMLGEAADPRLVGRLGFLDVLVLLSEAVRAHVAHAFAQCGRLHDLKRTPALAVIPHGLDARLFHPLADRRAARAAIPGLADAGFVILNANRNLPRKRIDLTLDGFARFARGKPADVRLYLHMAEAADGHALGDRIRALGIAGRVVLAGAATGGHPQVDDKALNCLYNACDVGLNTASSEGWGMVSFEHAATGAAQVVPDAWVCGEVWGDHAERIALAPAQPSPSRFVREVAVCADAVAGALERLYADPARRRDMAGRALALAREARFQWASIGDRWDDLLTHAVTASSTASVTVEIKSGETSMP